MQTHAAPAWRGLLSKIPALVVGSTLPALALAGPVQGADVPRPAPVLDRPALDGIDRRLDSTEAGVVLVHFFATWCEPCRDEMAALDRLDAAMAGRAFAILAVDVAEPEIRVRRFFATHPVRFPILLDEDRTALKTWEVKAFPTSLLVTGTGERRTVRLHAAEPVDWDDPAARRQIDRLLAGEEPDAALPAVEATPEQATGATQ